jgi:hypothetical protein
MFSIIPIFRPRNRHSRDTHGTVVHISISSSLKQSGPLIAPPEGRKEDQFRYRYVEPHFRSALKLAKANGGSGWDVVAEQQRLLRYLAAVLCRGTSRMLRGATRSRPAGSRSCRCAWGCSSSE